MLYFFNDYSSGNYLQPQCLPKYFFYFFLYGRTHEGSKQTNPACKQQLVNQSRWRGERQWPS